jgi:Ca2+:H+ antiporter
MSDEKSSAFLLREWRLAANVATTALFLIFGDRWLADLSGVAWFVFVFIWLFGVILVSAFAVVRHAEAVAEKLGEPAGTLVLTLCVTGIEVMMISAVMLTGKGNASLARDAMFAVVMIVLNGMIGIALLLGGLRHREQEYNLKGASAFLAVIVPLSVLGLVLPNYAAASAGPTFSPAQAVFLSIMSIALYGVFLAIQNVRHRDYFTMPSTGGAHEDGAHHGASAHTLGYHLAILVAYLLPLVVLSKKIAIPIDHAIAVLHAPAALGGFLVAVLILSPESLAATRAALANQLQRSINVLLGSVLATIGLTIPSVLTIGFVTHQTIVLGLDGVDTVLLLLTLTVSILTFSSPRTNVLLGAVHLVLFLAYLLLIFER